MPHDIQLVQLRDEVVQSINISGAQLVTDMEHAAAIFLKWLQFLASFKRTETANELLDAVACTIREAAACLALGLVRPTLFSMRTQIDLMLAWLYFKDHPVEWRVVNRTGDGFKLKKELLEYLANTVEGFGARYALLKLTSTRTEQDTYRLLSAHIHGQSSPVLPAMANLCEVVRPATTCQEVTVLARELSEYIGDILYAVYAPDFASLPPDITQQIDSRFSTIKQKAEFYGTI